jgi:hypothetical protein
MGPARQRARAGPAHARPLRPPHRRGRVPPRLPRADDRRDRPRAARRAVGRRPGRGARGPRREGLRVGPGRGWPPLPDLHDLRRRARAAPQPGPRRALRAAAHGDHLRPRPARAGDQARADRRHVDDREAGRLGRAGQHHARGAAARRQLPADRPQVVHLRADVRRVPRARPGARRAVLLPAPACAARRHAQPDAPAAAQGQARQPLERVVGGRVRPSPGSWGRRARASARSSRWST